MKPRLSFYTNIPTPYQADFFAALADWFTLTVVYYASTERDRQWSRQTPDPSYQTVWLRDNVVARWIQRWITDYHFSWSIIGTARRLSADYVIVSGSYWVPNTLLAMLIARKRGQPVAFFGERLAGATVGWRAVAKRMLLWPLKKMVRRIVAIGHEAALTYEQFGVTAQKTIIPYSICLDRFVNEHIDAVDPPNPLTLLSVGSLIPRKGMDTLIRAFRRLSPDRYGHVRLHILGEGPERTRLQQLIGSDERIQLLGFKDADERVACFRQAHVFVLASRYDGWGVVVNEAIAAGLPIISSNRVGAAVEWVQPGQNGFLCAPADESAFEQAMRQLIDQPTVRNRQAAYNRRFRAQTSSAYYAAQLYEQVITDLSA